MGTSRSSGTTERYYNGYGRDNPHDLHSATKSITSLLTGIAIERGAVAGVDAPLMDYLGPAYLSVRDKDELLLRHLLTMSSGLDCDDGDRGTRGQEDRMYRSTDWVAYFLSLVLLGRVEEAGALFAVEVWSRVRAVGAPRRFRVEYAESAP